MRYGFVPRRVHFIFLKARIFPYLSCWNAPLRYTMGTMCGFLSRQRCSTDFFSAGDGGDANWKYLKDGYTGDRWFQIYTLRIYFLPMGFITIVGEYFWICCPTTKQANLRDVEHVETSFRFQWCFDLFFSKENHDETGPMTRDDSVQLVGEI